MLPSRPVSGGVTGALLRAILVVQGAALGFVTTPTTGLHAGVSSAVRRLSVPALRPAARRSPAIFCQVETETALTSIGGSDAEAAWRSAAGGDYAGLTAQMKRAEVMRSGVVPPERLNLAELAGDKALVVFMRHVSWPFCWELALAVNEARPRLEAAGVNVVVTAVASPTKAQAFLDAEGQFPPSMFYCSQDLQAYKTLGFHGKFGAEQEGGGKTVFAGFMDGMKSRFLPGGKKWSVDMKAYGKLEPFGVVSDTKPGTKDDLEAVTMLGGAFAVVGGEVVMAHRDRSVSDHVSIDAALQSLGV